MNKIAADSLYEASYRSTWGADEGPLGHLVIRRLDDHEVIVEIPATDEDQARRLIDGAEELIHGPADVFQNVYGIESDIAANPAETSRSSTPALNTRLKRAMSSRRRRRGGSGTGRSSGATRQIRRANARDGARTSR